MKFIESKLCDQIIEINKVKHGILYFLKDMVVAEFKEGVHVDFNSSEKNISLIVDFYGYERPFGYLCNRINDFSISPLDYTKFNKALPNLEIYGIVHKNHFDRINYNIEKRFCNKPFNGYSDLYTAFNQLSIFVNKSKSEFMNTSLLNKSRNVIISK